MKPVIIIADSNTFYRVKLCEQLSTYGYVILEACSKKQLFLLYDADMPDILILGPSWENVQEWYEVTEFVRERGVTVPVILIAKRSSEELILNALRAGISDFFIDSIKIGELALSIKKILTRIHLNLLKQSKVADPENGKDVLLGQSSSMREVKKYLLRVAMTNSNVLITGETGTGKELATWIIHKNSPRGKKILICINCAALPENLVESELFGHERGAFTGAVVSKTGKFEQAAGGTVLLDEISDMSLYAQAKLLRVIENKQVYRIGGKFPVSIDVRIIAATNRELEQLVRKGEFRKDLYYRLNIARVNMPPLRKRKDDIPLLVSHFIRHYNHQFSVKVDGFTEKAWASLMLSDWPGNVRELKNLIEATYININHPSREIDFTDFPIVFQKRFEELAGLTESERNKMVSTLFATNWNKSKAAERLNWSRMTFYRKMAKYNIVKERKPRHLSMAFQTTKFIM